MKEGSKWHVLYCVIILILGLVILYQAKNDNTQAKAKGVGEYVYIDNARTLHTAHDCPAVYRIPNTNQQPIRRKGKDELVMEHLNKICSRCVTDTQYDILRAAVRVNEGNGVFYDDE